MQQPYTPPKSQERAFHCPHPGCGVYANQDWAPAFFVGEQLKDVSLCRCMYCGQISIWRNGAMVYPDGGIAPLPNPDLPEGVAKDYEEARGIVVKSPRGAAALLRLAIQRLCQDRGEPGKDLNADIGSLVKKGLPDGVRKALDAVRVIGNNAVDPGQIDLTDDIDTATALFNLVNFIAEKMISEPNEIDRIHALLPPGALKQIEKRDNAAME
jgi:hypothetical protein